MLEFVLPSTGPCLGRHEGMIRPDVTSFVIMLVVMTIRFFGRADFLGLVSQTLVCSRQDFLHC